MQRLVFLDETGLNTKMVRHYGRAPVGERCQAAVPFRHWQTATFIAALRHDRINAPWLTDGPMEGAVFLTYVEKVLGPELRPGDLVICDNLSSHKVAGVREALATCGARLRYLPAYSPDLNPIEMAFAKLKTDLRRAAARDWEGLLAATASALATFTPEHCRNFMRHAHYATDSLENALGSSFGESEQPGTNGKGDQRRLTKDLRIWRTTPRQSAYRLRSSLRSARSSNSKLVLLG